MTRTLVSMGAFSSRLAPSATSTSSDLKIPSMGRLDSRWSLSICPHPETETRATKLASASVVDPACPNYLRANGVVDTIEFLHRYHTPFPSESRRCAFHSPAFP